MDTIDLNALPSVEQPVFMLWDGDAKSELDGKERPSPLIALLPNYRDARALKELNESWGLDPELVKYDAAISIVPQEVHGVPDELVVVYRLKKRVDNEVDPVAS